MSGDSKFMTGLAYAAPALSAIGSLRGGREDATRLRRQAEVARAQSQADEQAQRREGRQALGRLAASMAEGGGGIDERVLEQSSVMAELDALNIRYAGQMQAEGLLSDARAAKKQSKLLAGAQLLSGVSRAYTAGRRLNGGP